MDVLTPTLGATLGLGFVLGLQHATEPDHVVAVSAIVTEHRSVWRSALVGAFWGIGHTLALLVAGMILLLVRTRISEWFGAWLETAVAVMIVWLGVGVLRRLARDKTLHVHAHAHDGHAHMHFHVHDRGHEHEHAHAHGPAAWRLKPLLVGVIHGLAGSGALVLLVMQELPTLTSGMLYIAVFGAGTIVGMWAMSGLLSLPLAAVAGRYERMQRGLCGAVGLGSVLFGVYYGWTVWTRA